MKLSRYFVWQPLALVLVLLILLLLLAAFLLFSRSGTQWLLDQAQAHTSGLTITNAQGTLANNVTADEVRWTNGDVTITAQGVALDNNLSLKQAQLEQFDIQSLVIRTPRAGPGPVIIPNLSTPFNVLLSNAKVDHFEFWVGDNQFALNEVTIKARTVDGSLIIEELKAKPDIGGGELYATLKGELGLGTPHDINLALQLNSSDPKIGIGTLNLTAKGPDNRYRLEGKGQWAYQNLPNYEVQLTGAGNMEQLNIERLHLRDPADESSGDLAGYVNWYDAILWKFDTNLKGADLADIGLTTPSNLDASFSWSGEKGVAAAVSHWSIHSVTGSLQNYPVKGKGEFSANQGVIEVKQVDAAIGDNRLTMSGKADNALAVDWNLDAPYLAQIAPQLQGALKGKGTLQGKLDGSDLAVDITDLSGQLQGYPVQINGQLTRQNNSLAARALRINVGDNRITLDGDARERLGLMWTLDAKALEQLNASLKGNLTGSGRLEGLLDASHLNLNIDGLKGRVNDYPIQAQGQFQRQNDVITAQNMRLDIGDNRLNFDGTSASNTVGINWQLEAKNLQQLYPSLSGQVSASGNLKGLLDGSQAELTISRMRGNFKGQPLQAFGQVKLDNKVLSAKDLVLTVGDNNVTLNGSANETIGLTWSLDAKNLAQVRSDLAGNLKGEGTLKGLLDGSKLDVGVNSLKGNVKNVPIDAQGLLHLENKTLSARDVILNAGRNRLTLNGSASDNVGLDWSLEAGDLTQLSPKLNGRLSGTGTLKGLLDGSQLEVNVNRLAGQVNNYNVTAKGLLGRKNKLYSARDLVLAVGNNEVTLNGNAGDSLGLDWKLDARQLSQLKSDLKGELQGSGTLSGVLDGSRLDVQIKRLSGSLQGYPLTVSGGLKRQGEAITARDLVVISGKNQVILNGSATDAVGVSWEVDLKDLTQFKPDLTGRLKGRGKLQGLLDGSRLDVAIQQLDGQIMEFPLSASGQVGLRNKQLSARDLVVAVGQNKVVLNGQASDRVGVNWSLDARNLAQLNPQLQGALQGNGRLEGTIDGSNLSISINQLTGKFRDYPVAARGQVAIRNKAFSTDGLTLEVGQNRVLLSGQASDKVAVNWQLDGRNLSQLSPKLKGALKGQGRLTSRLDGSDLKIDIDQISGQLNGYPLLASGQVSRQGEQWRVQQANVRAGDNTIQLTGQVTEPLDLQWRIDGRQLAQVLPGLAGRLQGQGIAKGSWAQPQIQGQLSGSQLRYNDISIDSLTADVGQQGGRYTANATLKGVRQGTTVFNQIVLEAQGLPDNHRIHAAINHKEGKADLTANGRWVDGVWAGTVQSLELRDTPAGQWRLTQPVALQFGKGNFSSGEICLSNGQGALCAQPNITAAGIVASGRLQQMPLVMLKPWLPSNVQLQGTVEGTYQLDWRNGRGNGQANLRFPDSTIRVLQTNGKSEQYTYRNAQAVMTLTGNTVSLQGQAAVDQYGALSLDGRIDLAQKGEPRIDAVIRAESPNIAWLESMTPDLGDIQGQLSVDVQLQGALSRPAIKGIVKLEKGQAYLSETGALLQDINLTIQTTDAQTAIISGTLRAGKGTLRANGTMRLANMPKWSADVVIQGDRLLLMDTHEIQAWASPDLHITATPGNVNIQGTVLLPELIVSLRELPSTANVRSPDVVIVGRRAQRSDDVVITGRRAQAQTNYDSEAATPIQGARLLGAGRPNLKAQDAPLNINPDVVLELGEKAIFSGFGLDARMQGRIRILRTRQDIIGMGSLSIVNGVYKAYGQNLKIERGRLIFNGALENPGLDVQAVRSVENGDVKVGITLSGTVRRPESVLFSIPTQTQSDTLSYLITGHSASSLTGSDTNILKQAILGLGIVGGESIANQLGIALGLDEVGINSSGSDYKQSELLLGKRLGPRLYVKYIVGLFDSVQRVAITYQINKRLQLEAQTGKKQGVDLIYKIDTDKGPFRRHGR